MFSLGRHRERSRKRDGAIAQLGERRVCNAKVVGSIPTGSTNYYQRVMSHAQCLCMTHGMRADQRARVSSLKIRQFVLTLKRRYISIYG